MRRLFALVGLIVSTVIFMDGMWIIDSCIWGSKGSYIYIPFPGLWGVFVNVGNAVNIGYYMMAIGFILVAICSYFLGSQD